MWLNNFKVAIAQKDVDKIEMLVNETLDFDDVKDAKEAMFLLREAMELLFTLKDETENSMKQIKKNLNFLESTQSISPSSLDIRF